MCCKSYSSPSALDFLRFGVLFFKVSAAKAKKSYAKFSASNLRKMCITKISVNALQKYSGLLKFSARNWKIFFWTRDLALKNSPT